MVLSSISLLLSFAAPSPRLVASLPPHLAGHRAHVAPRMVAGLLTGEKLPPDVIETLAIEGQRTALLFYCRDDGFECGKQLLDFQQRAAAYASADCKIVAVRSNQRGAVKEGTDAQYPDIRFVVDEDDAIREKLRMTTGGVRNGDRHTYLVDSTGRVQGQVNNYPDAFCHSQCCLRTLKAMDDPANPWDAASAEVDEMAAKYQALYEQEQEERTARRKELADAEAAQGKAVEAGSEDVTPATPTNQQNTPASFFEGFFGAFKK